MVKSPEPAGLPAAAQTLADRALDGLRDAVLIINTRQRELPVVFANATARRLLTPRGQADRLDHSPLYAWLAAEQGSTFEARLEMLSKLRPSASASITWRLGTGEETLTTELSLLGVHGSGRMVMVRFAPLAPRPGRRATIDKAAAQLLILDTDLKVTYASSVGRHGAAADAGTLQGRSALRVVPTAALDEDVYRRVLAGATHRDPALEFSDKPRPSRWFDVSLQPLMGTAGVAGIIVLATDVTERRRWDRAQSRDEGRLHALTEHAHDVIAVASADGEILYVSGGVTNALGFSPAERRSKSTFDLLHPDDAQRVRERYRSLVRGECPSFTEQLRVRHKDGRFRWFESTCVSELDNPLIGGIVINSHDITARKLAEHQLMQREEVFRLAAEAVNGIIFEWDIVQGTVHRSRGVLEVLGLGPDEMAADAEAWYGRVHPADLAATKANVAAALPAAPGWTVTYRIRDASGRYRTLLQRALIQRDAGGAPLRAIGCDVDVTELNRLSDLLSDTQRAAQTGGWEYFYQTGALAWTDETFHIFGTNRGQFAPSLATVGAQLPEESRRRLGNAFLAADVDCKPIDVEVEILTLPGARLWVRVVGNVDRAAGRRVRAYGSLQNIQAQKMAQAALEGSTGWLKLSASMAQLRPWRWDRHRDTLEFAALRGRASRAPRIVRGMRSLMARLHPDDCEAVQRATERVWRGESEVREEFRLRTAGGGYRCYATVARPVIDAQGQIQGVVGVTQDITANRDSEIRLRRSEELLRLTTANTADLLVLADQELRIRFINRGVQGETPQALIGRHVGVIVPGPAHDPVIETLRAAMGRDEAVSFDYETVLNGGAVASFEVRTAPIRDEGPACGISIAVRDITERKRMEREILEAAGRERQRIGQDLHDGLGQELTGIALMLRGLALRLGRESDAVTAPLDEIVGLVNQAVDSARSMARGLLPVSIEHGGLMRALGGLAGRCGKAYGIDVRLRANRWPLLSLGELDASHLYRIAQEALANAARHGQAKRIDIHLSVDDGRYVLSIADDGIGMSAVPPSGGGMGLRIMHYRADVIGAKLEVHTNQPCGTIVRVTGTQPPTRTGV